MTNAGGHDARGWLASHTAAGRARPSARPVIFAFLGVIVFGALKIWGTNEITARVPAPYNLIVVHVVGVVLFVALALLADRVIRHFFWNGYLRHRRKQDTPALIEDLFTAALIVLGLALGLSFEAGVSLTGLGIASSATAIVLGIALQAVIQDLFSGLSINFDGSYVIGDWLTIYSSEFREPAYGCVTGITWRTTFLRQMDGTRLIIPNRMVTANPVINHSRPGGPKRYEVELPFDNRFPSERVISILTSEAYRAVKQRGLLQFPEPYVIATKFASDSIMYEVRFFADPAEITPPQARSLMAVRVQAAMLRHRISTPVSQVELTPPPDGFAFDEEEVREALHHVPLFADVLDAEQLQGLARSCPATLVPDEAVIIHQGESTASMFIIMEGAARITVAGADGVARDVAVVSAGDVVGEMSLMTGAPRTATVTAITPLRVLEITKDAIEALLKTSPGLLERFSHVLAQRQLELSALAARHEQKEEVELDLLNRMRVFFARTFG